MTMWYKDCKGKPLSSSKLYLLKCHGFCGSELPKSDWIAVRWDGSHLYDMDGCYWDEWLPSPEDIVPV